VDNLISITKDDIVAIKVSDYETKLNKTKTHINAAIRKLNATVIKQSTAHDKALQCFAEDKSNTKIQKAITAIKDLYGQKTNIASLRNVDSVNYEEKKITFSASVSLSDAKKHVGKALLEFNFDAKISLALLTEKKAIDDNKTEIEDLNNQLYEVNKALMNIDVVERQAKAALAKKVIGSTEEGLNFIDSIESIPGVSGVKLIGSGD